jgi:hypothetical protein
MSHHPDWFGLSNEKHRLKNDGSCHVCGRNALELGDLCRSKPKYILLPIHPGNVEFVKRVGVSLGKTNVGGVGEVEVWDLPE